MIIHSQEFVERTTNTLHKLTNVIDIWNLHIIDKKRLMGETHDDLVHIYMCNV
jgi:hypothetical protein